MRNKSCFIFFFRPTNDANNCNYWLRPIFYSIFVRGTSSERAWEKFSSKTKQINVNCYLRSIEWHHTKLSSFFNLKVSRICNEWIPNGDIFRESTSAQSSMKCHFYPEIVSSDNGIVAKSCVEIPARDFQSFPRSSRHLFTFSRVLFIITKFISFLLRLAFASNKYFPCFFFSSFLFYFMTPITVMDNNFLSNTRSRLRFTCTIRPDDGNGKWTKFKVIYSFGARPKCIRIRHLNKQRHRWERWTSTKVKKKRRTSLCEHRVSVWRDVEARLRTHSPKMKPKWWICKYILFFSILFLSHFSYAGKRRRMPSTADAWLHADIYLLQRSCVHGKWSSFPFSA